MAEVCTRHASIDAARARSLLEDANGDSDRMRQVYSDCFFDGSVAAAEAAMLFAQKTTNSGPKAVELANILRSLPTAVPLRTVTPLARLCTFLTFSFSEKECRAPLNTFCYADAPVKRACYKAVFEKLRDSIEGNPGELRVMLDRVRVFFNEVMTDSEEIDRHVIVSHFVRLAHGISSNARKDLFYFILELDAVWCSSHSLAVDDCGFEDYDSFLAFELFGLATEDRLKALVFLRSMVYGLEFGKTGPLNTLWTSYQAQIVASVRVIGSDIVLLLLLAMAARLACSGNISECRSAVSIANHVMNRIPHEMKSPHDVIRNILVSLCASVGATSSACKDEGVSGSIAALLRTARSCTTTSAAKGVRGRLLRMLLDCRRWRCLVTFSFIGLVVKLVELWSRASEFVLWLPRLREILVQCCTMPIAEDQTGNIVSETSFVGAETPTFQECSSSDTYGALLALVSSSILGHPVTCVRLKVAEALGSLNNDIISLFCLPTFLIHLQHETNGAIAVKIIRGLLSSPSLLQRKETSKIALHTCTKFFGQSANKTGFNSSSYEVFLSTLGYGTEKAPGLATSLLLREIERLKESFGLTRSPVRASASAAILKLVELRPTRGTNFIPFISLCIAPDSMEVAPEASSLCFEVMYVMAEEEVLDATKAVKIVLKNYPNVTDVDPKARRSYIRLLGAVSGTSSTKKGAVLAKRVIGLLRRCLTAMKPRGDRKSPSSEQSDCDLSWHEIEQAAHSLRKFSVEDILRLAHAGDEVLLDIEAEAERKEAIEKECQDFTNDILSLTTEAQGQHESAAASLTQLLVKVVSYEWENRRRISFDPDRIGKLRAASDALRRARRSRGAADDGHMTGKDSFSRVVKGLPTGVVKGVLESCVWNGNGDRPEETKAANCFSVAVRVLIAAKALSSAFPWVPLIEEVRRSLDCDADERASCLAVLRVVEGNNFELKDARELSFGPQSSLANISTPTSEIEAKELFLGMIQFNPSEALRQLFKIRTTTSSKTLLVFIRASKHLENRDLITVAEGLFPMVTEGKFQGETAVTEMIEREFYDTVLSRCTEDLVEGMLLKDIIDPAVIRIACMTKSFTLLCEAARVLLSHEEFKRDLVATVGLTVNSLDAAYRKEFVLEVCANTGDDDLAEKRKWLAAHVYGVAAFLPHTDLALSVAECFSAAMDRDGVRRTIASILQ